MLTDPTAGLKPCETTTESYTYKGSCRLCEQTASGYDAAFGGPLCATCATAFGEFYTDLVEDRDE
jgi:hypothetical protein